jgi:hypothetical protein
VTVLRDAIKNILISIQENEQRWTNFQSEESKRKQTETIDSKRDIHSSLRSDIAQVTNLIHAKVSTLDDQIHHAADTARQQNETISQLETLIRKNETCLENMKERTDQKLAHVQDTFQEYQNGLETKLQHLSSRIDLIENHSQQSIKRQIDSNSYSMQSQTEVMLRKQNDQFSQKLDSLVCRLESLERIASHIPVSNSSLENSSPLELTRQLIRKQEISFSQKLSSLQDQIDLLTNQVHDMTGSHISTANLSFGKQGTIWNSTVETDRELNQIKPKGDKLRNEVQENATFNEFKNVQGDSGTSGRPNTKNQVHLNVIEWKQHLEEVRDSIKNDLLATLNSKLKERRPRDTTESNDCTMTEIPITKMECELLLDAREQIIIERLSKLGGKCDRNAENNRDVALVVTELHSRLPNYDDYIRETTKQLKHLTTELSLIQAQLADDVRLLQ